MDRQELKEVGLKVTNPRMKVLAILEQAPKHHLSAEEIHKALLESQREIGLATIYRVLTQFQEAGIVKRHNFESGRCVFELDSGEHHDHLVCIQCGRIEEFIDNIIESRQKSIAEKANFQITDHSLSIYGICAGCNLTP